METGQAQSFHFDGVSFIDEAEQEEAVWPRDRLTKQPK